MAARSLTVETRAQSLADEMKKAKVAAMDEDAGRAFIEFSAHSAAALFQLKGEDSNAKYTHKVRAQRSPERRPRLDLSDFSQRIITAVGTQQKLRDLPLSPHPAVSPLEATALELRSREGSSGPVAPLPAQASLPPCSVPSVAQLLQSARFAMEGGMRSQSTGRRESGAGGGPVPPLGAGHRAHAGAALVGSSGRIYTGASLYAVTLSLTHQSRDKEGENVPADKVALMAALSAGETAFQCLLLVNDSPVSWMLPAGPDLYSSYGDFPVLSVRADGEMISRSTAQLVGKEPVQEAQAGVPVLPCAPVAGMDLGCTSTGQDGSEGLGQARRRMSALSDLRTPGLGLGADMVSHDLGDVAAGAPPPSVGSEGAAPNQGERQTAEGGGEQPTPELGAAEMKNDASAPRAPAVSTPLPFGRLTIAGYTFSTEADRTRLPPSRAIGSGGEGGRKRRYASNTPSASNSRRSSGHDRSVGRTYGDGPVPFGTLDDAQCIGRRSVDQALAAKAGRAWGSLGASPASPMPMCAQTKDVGAQAKTGGASNSHRKGNNPRPSPALLCVPPSSLLGAGRAPDTAVVDLGPVLQTSLGMHKDTRAALHPDQVIRLMHVWQDGTGWGGGMGRGADLVAHVARVDSARAGLRALSACAARVGYAEGAGVQAELRRLVLTRGQGGVPRIDPGEHDTDLAGLTVGFTDWCDWIAGVCSVGGSAHARASELAVTHVARVSAAMHAAALRCSFDVRATREACVNAVAKLGVHAVKLERQGELCLASPFPGDALLGLCSLWDLPPFPSAHASSLGKVSGRTSDRPMGLLIALEDLPAHAVAASGVGSARSALLPTVARTTSSSAAGSTGSALAGCGVAALGYAACRKGARVHVAVHMVDGWLGAPGTDPWYEFTAEGEDGGMGVGIDYAAYALRVLGPTYCCSMEVHRATLERHVGGHVVGTKEDETEEVGPLPVVPEPASATPPPPPTVSPPSATGPALPVGTRVYGRYKGGNKAFPGVVTGVHMKQGKGAQPVLVLYDLQYEDGDVERRVQARWVKARDGVTGQQTQGQNAESVVACDTVSPSTPSAVEVHPVPLLPASHVQVMETPQAATPKSEHPVTHTALPDIYTIAQLAAHAGVRVLEARLVQASGPGLQEGSWGQDVRFTIGTSARGLGKDEISTEGKAESPTAPATDTYVRWQARRTARIEQYVSGPSSPFLASSDWYTARAYVRECYSMSEAEGGWAECDSAAKAGTLSWAYMARAKDVRVEEASHEVAAPMDVPRPDVPLVPAPVSYRGEGIGEGKEAEEGEPTPRILLPRPGQMEEEGKRDSMSEPSRSLVPGTPTRSSLKHVPMVVPQSPTQGTPFTPRKSVTFVDEAQARAQLLGGEVRARGDVEYSEGKETDNGEVD